MYLVCQVLMKRIIFCYISLNEIGLLLKTCDDIVRLRIKKDDIYSEDNLCENIVVYKVQLFRQG